MAACCFHIVSLFAMRLQQNKPIFLLKGLEKRKRKGNSTDNGKNLLWDSVGGRSMVSKISSFIVRSSQSRTGSDQ